MASANPAQPTSLRLKSSVGQPTSWAPPCALKTMCECLGFFFFLLFIHSLASSETWGQDLRLAHTFPVLPFILACKSARTLLNASQDQFPQAPSTTRGRAIILHFVKMRKPRLRQCYPANLCESQDLSSGLPDSQAAGFL